MEINYKKSIIKLGSEFPWRVTENWNSTFPFAGASFDNDLKKDLPPIYVGLNIEPKNANVLADFSISEMRVPLLLISEKGPLRFAVWSSPDLNQLYLKSQNENYFNLLKTFDPIISG